MIETPVLNKIDINKKIDVPSRHSDLIEFIRTCYSFKPEGLIISENKWKYLIRSVVRGRNVLICGPAGYGKTIIAKCVQRILNRPSFMINLGSTQDPRTVLVGAKHFKKDIGTIFNKSYFIEAITTPNAIILLDELSRSHPEVWNMLMSVLDQNQKYIRLDEDENHTTINVADGVSFISTANIGHEYTSTRTIDKALLERFLMMEVDILNEAGVLSLLKYSFPLVEEENLIKISNIYSKVFEEYSKEGSRISTLVSPRMAMEMAELMYDGFSLSNAADAAIYPYFSADGGNVSERVYVKEVTQAFIGIDEQTNGTSDVPNSLFGSDFMNGAIGD